MAGVGDFLVAYIAADADLPAIVGNRVAPMAIVRKYIKPRIAYRVGPGSLIRTINGITDLRRTELEIETQADTYAVAHQIAELLVGTPADRRLAGYQGTLGGIQVQGCHLDTDIDDFYDPPSQPDGVGVFVASLTFIVWYKRTG